MADSALPDYWIFSNKPSGAYGERIWDMSTILRTNRYWLKKSEKNLGRVKVGDVVYLRTYGRGIVGRCVIGGPWKEARKQEDKGIVAGAFPITDVEWWSHPVPQSLVFGELSNQNHRMRIARATPEDAIRIETARRICERLGLGQADGEIIVLERGLEEAIKPNLPKLGLHLANQRIRQQFSMGVGVGRSDLICEDNEGNLVVVELKRGSSSDEVVGQVLSYVGWLKENVAKEGQEVKGIICTGDFDERLRLAAKAAHIKVILVRLA